MTIPYSLKSPPLRKPRIKMKYGFWVLSSYSIRYPISLHLLNEASKFVRYQNFKLHIREIENANLS